MDGIDQLIQLNDEYIRGVLPPQDYKRNVTALVSSFTEDELKRFSDLIASGEAHGYGETQAH